MMTTVSKRKKSVSASVNCLLNINVGTVCPVWLIMGTKQGQMLTSVYPGTHSQFQSTLKTFTCCLFFFCFFLMSIHVRSVLLRRTMTCWTRAPRPRHCPSSLPFLRLSNQQCVTTQRRPGGVTSTSSSVMQTAPVQSTRFKCFLHSFRYRQL